MTDEDPVYRAPMRARSVEADPFEGARFGIRHALVGTGEPLRQPPGDLDQAIFESDRQYGEKSGRMLERFAGLPKGTLVWTRTGDDEFRLGRIEGVWRYEESASTESGICQVREAVWLPQTFDHLSAPRGVGATFSRGGRNFQRIRDRTTEIHSNELWIDLHD